MDQYRRFSVIVTYISQLKARQHLSLLARVAFFLALPTSGQRSLVTDSIHHWTVSRK